MNRIYIGMGTCGLASGSEQVKDAVVRWVDEKKANVRITATGCIGYCQAEPIVDIVSDCGHRVSFGEVKPESVRTLLDRVLGSRDYGIAGVLGQYRNGSGPLSSGALKSVPFIDEHPFFKKQLKLILKNCGVIELTSIADYRAAGGLRGLERTLSMTPEQVVDEVLRSGLRGRGGGGQIFGYEPERIRSRIESIYRLDLSRNVRLSYNSPAIKEIYERYLGRPGSEKAHELLHTHYVQKPKRN